MQFETSRRAEAVTPSAVRPARLITYAWGERYLDDLLSITLPAALAPGNLPYLASVVPCEVVLLTEEKFRSRIDRHPTAQRIRRLCPLHLVGLDDLVHAKDKYGMTLTYALHRGSIDLGRAVTESYLFFLNADFVVAENSFRSVLSSLTSGKRLIAAPSYCVNYGTVAPVLRSRVAAGALAIPHRELADLALGNLHNTVRGKTLNQHKFHLKQIDQFYWQADAHTLLGHQMPIAIVGMRPEREVAEPNSFWDHGLISEFCPSEEPHVLGDSDDFLMVELREREVAQEQIARGKVDPSEAGERMIGWVTPYQRSFAPYELTLHSRELPPNADRDRAALSAQMNDILAHCPAFLPSHLEHPQWGYHLGPFMTARHSYLSRQFGQTTETEQPPANSLPIDRVWWQIDGATKRYERKKARLQHIHEHVLALLDEQANQLSKSVEIRQKNIRRRFVAEASPIVQSFAEPPSSPNMFYDARIEDRSCRTRNADQPQNLKKYSKEIEAVLTQHEERAAALSRARKIADDLYMRELEALSDCTLPELAKLEKQYARLMRTYVTSAVVPRVQFRKAPDRKSANQASVGIAAKLAARARYRLYRGPLQRIRRMMRAVCGSGPSIILVVTGGAGWADREASRFSGTCASVTVAELLSGNLASAVDPAIRFDVCLCELSPGQLFCLDKLADAVRRSLKPGAPILGLYWHTRQNSLALDDFTAPDGLTLRVSVDQFPARMAYLASEMERMAVRRLPWRLLRSWRVRLKRAYAARVRSLFLKPAPNVSPLFGTNTVSLGTAITIELIPTVGFDADQDSRTEIGRHVAFIGREV